MKLRFEVEATPSSQDDQAVVTAIGDVLSMLLVHIEKMHEQLAAGKGLHAWSETLYDVNRPEAEGGGLSIKINYSNEGIKPTTH